MKVKVIQGQGQIFPAHFKASLSIFFPNKNIGSQEMQYLGLFVHV